MKKIFYIFILIHFTRHCFCQTNLVPNGNFESYTSCPYSVNTGTPDEVAKATSWYTTLRTPDYYHSCATYTYVSTPLNSLGFQVPASGKAYMGLIVYDIPTFPDDRETIESPLLTALV